MTIDAEFAKWWAFYAFAVLFVTGRKLLERKPEERDEGPRILTHGRHV